MGTRTALPACLLLALAPFAARAQVTIQETSLSGSGGLSDQVINIAECVGPAVSTLALSWTVTPSTTAPAAGSVFRVEAVNAADCSATTRRVQVRADVPTNGSVSGSAPESVDVASLLADPALVVSCTAGTSATIALCVDVYLNGSKATPAQSASGTITLDTRVPGAPTGVSASSGDSALEVSWTTPSGGVSPTNHRVTVRPCPAGFDPAVDPATDCTGQATTKNTNSANTSYRFTGLANGTWYAVTVQAVSAVGNGSSTAQQTPGLGQPQVVDDFWRRYQNANGQEEGGCGSGGAGLLALLGLLPLALRRRSP